MDGHVWLDAVAPRPTPNQSAAFVAEFCGKAGDLVEELGPDAVGNIIWYLMGSGHEVWHDVPAASPRPGEDAILALCLLYEGCFARHTSEWSGVGGQSRPLDSACCMLWNMDGGLISIPLFEEAKHLVPATHAMLEYALSLDSPSCWASALYPLGLIASEASDASIDAFLAEKKDHVPEDLLMYALAVRSRCIP